MVGGGLFIRLHTLSPQITVSLPVSKDQILAKMQEFDVALQMAVNARTELRSMIANLPDGKQFADIEIPLAFYENGRVIAWGNDSEHFRPSTFRLLQQFWLAPDHFLTKEDICLDVIEDEFASDLAIRLVINKARKELGNAEFPYAIETVQGRGYRLKRPETTVFDLENG